MTTYILRNIDLEFWHQVKTKALAEHKTIDEVLKGLLRGWLQDGNTPAIEGDTKAPPAARRRRRRITREERRA